MHADLFFFLPSNCLFRMYVNALNWNWIVQITITWTGRIRDFTYKGLLQCFHCDVFSRGAFQFDPCGLPLARISPPIRYVKYSNDLPVLKPDLYT